MFVLGEQIWKAGKESQPRCWILRYQIMDPSHPHKAVWVFFVLWSSFLNTVTLKTQVEHIVQTEKTFVFRQGMFMKVCRPRRDSGNCSGNTFCWLVILFRWTSYMLQKAREKIFWFIPEGPWEDHYSWLHYNCPQLQPGHGFKLNL